MSEIMVKIDNVSKEYRLGQIGGTTLRDELARKKAKFLKREDPTLKIGVKPKRTGELFRALNNVSFEVKKGERVGLIGHNGAGKSTLLKLISRVTAPSKGKICLNGRVASMLEVGTGFHGELTGRENIYMNGAILGMTKKEIDKKIEDIIDFSECREFIDTPVKRYSSGMYVKLAFSVAAHLDSEIMIMDEVLAVGDMAFQKKCIDKMNQVSVEQERTILYVSHNMNTIRQLCDRVVVLNHGEVVFSGNVEEGINIYFGIKASRNNDLDLLNIERAEPYRTTDMLFSRLVLDKGDNTYRLNDDITGQFFIKAKVSSNDVKSKFTVMNNGVPIFTSETDAFSVKVGAENMYRFRLSLEKLVPGKYTLKMVLFAHNDQRFRKEYDVLLDCYMFELVGDSEFNNNLDWVIAYSGFFAGKKIEVICENKD